MTRLKADFYCKNALEMAPLLIGKLLCRKIGKETIKLRITETESYYGIEDTASHAHKGKTQRSLRGQHGDIPVTGVERGAGVNRDRPPVVRLP